MALAVLAGAAQAAPLTDAPVQTLSGQVVALSEILLDDGPGALWARFRFIAPEIANGGGEIDPEVAARDMQILCDDIIAPYLVAEGIAPERIVISFSDRDVPFGQPDPDATQVFELFSLDDGVCAWEEF